jgi:hypothetical protein
MWAEGAGTSHVAVAVCQGDERVMGGGFELNTGPVEAVVVTSRPTSGREWTAEARTTEG